MNRPPHSKPAAAAGGGQPTSRIEELARSLMPNAPAAEAPMRLRPVPPPATERPVPLLSPQECAKCKAIFRWEKGDSDRPKAPLVLKVQVGSRTCDCGFGRPRSEKTKPAKSSSSF